MKKNVIPEKQLSAEAACDYIKDGMIVGLGTGTSAEFAVRKLGSLVRDGLSIRGIPTSNRTKKLAESEGIPLIDFSESMFIDLTIDGADEIDGNLNMIKGGGAALLQEKIVASVSRKEIIVGSKTKMVDHLGSFPLPVEVIPFGWQVVFNQLESLNGNPELRLNNGQPLLTDQGNYIVDCHFRKISNPKLLENQINMIPGVVENGLFINLCTKMILADGEKLIVKDRKIR